MFKTTQPVLVRLCSPVVVLWIAFLAGVPATTAQNPPDVSAAPAEDQASEVIKTAEAYKASLERLIPFEEASIKRAAEMLETRESLFAQGLVSKHDLEQSRASHADAKAKLDETVKKISESAHLIAEAHLEEELRKAKPPDPEVIIRYTGPETWSLSKLVTIESFFAARFGQTLPVSALGQTPLHDRLGFLHGDAIDVALHPDSPEGQELMNYLRTAGISFIAFRTAVPGSATGAHIHIGKPSARSIA